MSKPSEGYLTFYQESLFTDLELWIGETRFDLHQLVVGNASRVLANSIEKAKFASTGPESTEIAECSQEPDANKQQGIVQKVEKVGGVPWRGKLRLEIRSDLFVSFWPELVEYMYRGKLKQISTANIVRWFCLSTDLELTALKNELIDWIVTNLTKQDLFVLLPAIISDSRATEFLRYALSIIAKNFSDFVEAARYTSRKKLRYPESTSISVSKAPKSSSSLNSSSSSNQTGTSSSETDSTQYLFDWKIVPFQAMKDLLHDKNLFAASEQDVFDAIMHFLENYDGKELNTKEITSLFETVRFERLEYTTLEAALAHPLVPKELLSRALMARLAGFEKPSLSQSPPSVPTSPMPPSVVLNAPSPSHSPQAVRTSPQSPTPNGAIEPSPPHSREPSTGTQSNASPSVPTAPSAVASSVNIALWSTTTTSGGLSSTSIARDRRRQSYGRLFQWSSDFDTKGVLYYLGTKEYRSEWQNPFSQKLVDVTWSSIEKGKPSAIFEREPSECWTQDVPSSWFTVDMGTGRSLRITAYTLRHGGATKQDLIRNWTLKASVDGKEFITLMRHKDDESLMAPFATMTWAISGNTQAYRYFKVIQTGHNSSKHNFLSIGGVEFYGELIYDMSSASRFVGPHSSPSTTAATSSHPTSSSNATSSASNSESM